jgi:hypothetical protein
MHKRHGGLGYEHGFGWSVNGHASRSLGSNGLRVTTAEDLFGD